VATAQPLGFISIASCRGNTLLRSLSTPSPLFDPERPHPVPRPMKSIALRLAAFFVLTAASSSLLALPYLVGN
jgi:hypothetical protein